MRFIFILLFLMLTTVGATGQWTTIDSLNTPRYGATAVTLNGKIYVFGGSTTGGIILNTVEVFDPASGTWNDSEVPPFQIPRVDAAAAVLNGKIYLTGGLSGSNEYLDAVEVYDFGSLQWTQDEDMRRERRGHRIMTIYGTLCILGGIDEYGDYEEEIEYLSNGDWEHSNTDWPTPRVYPFVEVYQNVAYAFGGIQNFPSSDGFRGIVDLAWDFIWEPLPSLFFSRGNGASALVGDKMFMMGGTLNSGPSDLIEIYSIGNDSLYSISPMTSPRIAMASAVLNDEIYLIGGYRGDQFSPLKLVEKFDSTITPIIQPPQLPRQMALLKGYPNPFNGIAHLEVQLPASGFHELTIFDIQGRRIKSLHSGFLAAGEQRFRWNALDDNGAAVASGLYLAVLNHSEYQRTFKLVYLK